jgi:polyferredoxin
MTKKEKKESNLVFNILILLWVLSFFLLGVWFLFRSYTPVPASAEIADTVQILAMVLFIVASIAGCIYIVRLMVREQ